MDTQEIRKERTGGFTLIEMLIVITILAALVVGLIINIDPIEQVKKANDTKIKDAVIMLSTGGARYFATQGFMPWCTGALTCTTNPGITTDLSTAIIGPAVTTNLARTGDLKTDFINTNASILARIYIYGTRVVGTESWVVCFRPSSKTFQQDPGTLYNRDGTLHAGCPAAGVVCNWCVQ